MATTLGDELERLRLQRRALRLEALIVLFGERCDARDRGAARERTLAELGRELARIHRRLEEL